MFTETPTAPSHHPSLFLSLPLSFSSLLSPWRRKRCAETWANPASCKTPNSRQNWMLGLGVCAFTSECVCVRHSMRVHKCVNNCICLHVFVCLSEHVCVSMSTQVCTQLCACASVNQSVCVCACVFTLGKGLQHEMAECQWSSTLFAREMENECVTEREAGGKGGGWFRVKYKLMHFFAHWWYYLLLHVCFT